jgi:hypothetical protein
VAGKAGIDPGGIAGQLAPEEHRDFISISACQRMAVSGQLSAIRSRQKHINH